MNKLEIGGQVLSYQESLSVQSVYAKKRTKAAKRGWAILLSFITEWMNEGLTRSEICERTGLEPVQLDNAIERMRKKGQGLHRPNPQETNKIRSRAHKGSVGPAQGTMASLDTIIKLRENHSGRELTPLERVQAQLVFNARYVLNDRRVSLDTFYQRHGRDVPARSKKRDFVEAVLAGRVCFLEKERDRIRQNGKNANGYVSVDLADVVRIYDEFDPGAFSRWEDEVVFIRKHATTPLVRGKGAVIYKARETVRK